MAIDGYGGLEVADDGARTFPGSGGYVGSLSPVDGWGGLSAGLGAASNYYAPLMSSSNLMNICPIDDPFNCGSGDPGGVGPGGGPGGGCDCNDCVNGCNPPPPPPPPPPPEGGTSGEPACSDPTGLTCSGGAPLNSVPAWLANLLTPTPRTALQSQGPTYLVNPAQPAAIVQGIKPGYIVVAVLLAVVGYFAYRKFA